MGWVVVTPTPPGVLRSALIAGGHAPHIFEVFAHPETAAETVAQGATGTLRVNGHLARASIVDRLGIGDCIVRLTVPALEAA